MMLENIITSKTRIKILKLFLANINDRYYLRELERMLEESLSPLRRQLLKLVKMGILSIEYEGNLKFYRLNKNFSGIEELQRLILGPEITPVASVVGSPRSDIPVPEPQPQEFSTPLDIEDVKGRSNNKRIKYDIAVLTFVSIFVLATSVFVVYTSTKNLKQIAGLVSEKGAMFETESRTAAGRGPASATAGEMVSKRWKLLPGNIPALSSGETGGEKNTKEL